MNKFIEGQVNIGRKCIYNIAAAALISMIAGAQGASAAETGQVRDKPAVHKLGHKIHYLKKTRDLHRKPVVRMTSVTRTNALAYAAFVQPPRLGKPALLKVTYTLGDAGPLLGRSPWLCSPSGFGQRSSCRSRY